MLNNSNILITGGTGSFGKQFIKTVLNGFSPKKVIVYSRDELKQFEMRKEKPFDDERLRYFIGDVRDRERLYRAFDGVDYVVHAAALKQVPSCEYNPFEAVKTNILGAENVINVSIDRGVKRVVALSTDKACSPVNLYGATKLCSDKLFIAGNAYVGRHETRFSVVRYGNVSGSRGSVIPFFKSIIKSGGREIPITDARMTRFWIKLDQAVDLVIYVLEKMLGGELYVCKVPSIKIIDLAKAMALDLPVKIIGIRPGEKLHEMMISKDDARNTVEFDKYYVIEPEFDWWAVRKEYKKEGKPVPEDFEYTSGNNKEWLTVEQIRSMLDELYDEKVFVQ